MDATTPRLIINSNDRSPDEPGIEKHRPKGSIVTALIGACGFGMQLERSIIHCLRPRSAADLAGDIILGLIFLALAIQNSIFLIYRMRDLEVATKK
jgi:hypothetical protein